MPDAPTVRPAASTRRVAAAGLAAVVLCAAPAAAQAEDPAFGLWLVESGSAIVEIAPCDGSACAFIRWLETPRDPQGARVTDINNEDPALRGRQVCGLSMAEGFAREAPGLWTGGEIYSGEDGKTYSARMEVQDDGTLRLRGYVGLPIFGATQVWTRAQDDRGGC